MKKSQTCRWVSRESAPDVRCRGRRFFEYSRIEVPPFPVRFTDKKLSLIVINRYRTNCQFHDFDGNPYSKVIGLRKVLCADVNAFGYEDGTDHDFCLQVVTASTERAALRFYSIEDESQRNPRMISPLISANVSSASYLSKMFSAPGACLP